MKPTINKRSSISLAVIVNLFFLLIFSGTSLYASSGGDIYRVKQDYKIKRAPDGTVSLYSRTNPAAKSAFVFADFNADVLLLVYRRIDTNSMITSLSKKYYLSKTEARRSVKMALNELRAYDLIEQN